jgi:lysophospholipase L1-like esterase
MSHFKKTRRLLPRIVLASVSLSIAFAFAEFIDRLFLPEVSDTIIIPIGSINQKYHHPPSWPPIPTPAPDAVRIVFIGDSFTWGMGVKDRGSNAFPPLVGRYFREGSVAGLAPRTVQTINLGARSYSPSIYGVVLRDYAPILKPDIVVLALDDSDPQDDLLYKDLLKTDDRGLPLSVYPGLPGVPNSLLPVAKRIKLIRHVSGLYQNFIRGIEQKRDMRTRLENRFGHYRPGPGSQDQWNEAFDHSLGLVDAFHRYCMDHEIKLVIINYPYAPAVITDYVGEWVGKRFKFERSVVLEPTFHKAVSDFASARNIPYYDFTPYLRSLSDHEGIFNDEDGHYAEKGYELLARELVRVLVPIVDRVTLARSREFSIARPRMRDAVN